MSRYPPDGMLGPRAIAWWSLRSMTDGVRVEGLRNLPPSGPVLLVARHYHHLLDGAVLIRHLERPVHVVVALDWTTNALQRRWMERACAWARWPVVLRAGGVARGGAYSPAEVGRYVRRGLREAAALLGEGRVVAIFPEGYPVIDPSGTQPETPRDGGGFLPFVPGFRTLLRLARRDGAGEVPIVPVGFAYVRRGRRWGVTARLGAPLWAPAGLPAVERAVRELSA